MNIFFSTKRLQAIATVIKILLCSMKDELFSGYFYYECFTIEYIVCSRVYKSMSVQHYKFYILILSEVSLFLCKCFLVFFIFFLAVGDPIARSFYMSFEFTLCIYQI